MTGFKLYRKIKGIDSKAKVCFITAFETYYEEFRQEFFPLEGFESSRHVRGLLTLTQITILYYI
jgi:hypothetical protein